MTSESALRRQESQAKQPEVTTEVERLHVSAKMLEESVTMLETRLIPVLAERKLENGNASGSPEPVRVPLAEELHSAAQSLDRIRDRIGSVMARLEL
jgi:hypothetical protein